MRPSAVPSWRSLSRQMTRTISAWRLIEAGDRVMVALSGGKDSYTLFELLWRARARAPFSFDIVGVHLDQGQPGYDGEPLRAWLEAFGAPFEIVHRDTYSTVIAVVEEGKSYCGPCSRLRRGILYGTAERLGCNKIALGHHRDDALETLLLNLFHGGRLQAMPAIYTTDDGRFQVIRPLVECAEADIVAHARAAAYPILPCNLCGSQTGLRRDAMTRLLDELEQSNPHVRQVMLNALRNVRPTHLLDPTIMRRPAQPDPASSTDWETPEDAPPGPPAAPPQGSRLPVLPNDVL
jgi:tRNA 2-thiocytidine biosynthesis protein TtcA